MIKQGNKNISVAAIIEFHMYLTQFHILIPFSKDFGVFCEIISHFSSDICSSFSLEKHSSKSQCLHTSCKSK